MIFSIKYAFVQVLQQDKYNCFFFSYVLFKKFSGYFMLCFVQIKIFSSIFDLYYYLTMEIPSFSTQSQQQHKENQALTEASTDINGQWYTIHNSKNIQQDLEEEALRNKGQNRLQYRKLTQKLNTMGHQHEQKYLGTKDVITPNKQRIMKNVIEFQRQLKSQNKDYYFLQLSLRQIYKIIQGKNQQDLHLIRNSKFVPIFFQFIQKVPSLHKNQITLAIRVLQLGFKIIHIFSTLSVNRDYLILTKRLKNLVSLTSWMLCRDQKRLLYLSFKLINILLLHKNKEQYSIKTIINTTIQLILFSQIFKKIKSLLQQLFIDGYCSDTELQLQILKFVYNLLRSKREQQRQNNRETIFNQDIKMSPSLYQIIDFILGFFPKYLLILKQDEDQFDENKEKNFKENRQIKEELSLFVVNSYYLAFKVMNTSFELSYTSFKKDIDFQVLFPIVLQLTIYCKALYQKNPTLQQKNLFNEIIIFIGYIALNSEINQRRLMETQIFQQLCNLPILFLMDPHLKDILTPTMCCIIYGNKITLNGYLKDNSPQPIIKYLKKELQARSISNLSRKNSTQSLYSLALGPNQSLLSQQSYQIERINLANRFPEQYWQQLTTQLDKSFGIDG